VRAARTILHVDMDAFYASVEQRDDPALRGKPVVVGGGSNRGVVAAASYEVRRFGVHSAMPMREAMRRCPDLVRVAPRMSHYKAVSTQVFAVFAEFTPVIEGLSLDEAFLDVTASRELHGAGAEIARKVKQRIQAVTSLTASVGIAENKLVAKIASDLDKPDGLVEIMPGDYERILDPLPVSAIPGIGKQTLARLQAVHVRTIGDLRVAPDRDLEPVFGRYTQRMRDRAAGIDNRPVSASREEKSISAEETYDVDLADRSDMERELLRLAETTAGRLRKAGLQAGTVQIKVRLPDFQTFTRQRRLQPPASGTDQVFHVARALLRDWLGKNPGARIRLLGVGGSRLSPAGQPDLFGEPETGFPEAVDRAADDIRKRFGPAAVGRARTLKGRE
jgi:DNA polymerase-4